jgi:glycosyltransferase involved in cell wall biosynthesis
MDGRSDDRPIAPSIPTGDIDSTRKLPITAIILSFNEELHIERCIARIAPLVQRIVVVDSFSTDRTVEIARSLGADVLQHAFKNHAAQFQWGLENAGIGTPWVLKLDSDEYLEAGAQEELRRCLATMPADVTGLAFKLKVIFRDKWIRHGRYYSTVLLRLWRVEAGQMEQRWMDEHIVLSHGRVERVRGGDLVDHNLNDIGWWIDKHNRYATRHMVDFVNREFPLFEEDLRIVATGAQARRKRFLKNSVYLRAPLFLRCALFYFYRYVIRLGFLDGKEGFLFHFMHGFWMYMLMDAKLDEARSYIRAHGLDAFKARLRDHYGIAL